MMKRTFTMLLAVGLAALFGLAGPAAATVSPAATDVGVLVGAECRSGLVQVTQGPVNIRSAPRVDAPVLTRAAVGTVWICDWFGRGGIYRDTCNTSVANGWLRIWVSSLNRWGYAVSVCFRDV